MGLPVKLFNNDKFLTSVVVLKNTLAVNVTEGNVYSDTTRNSARKAALEINEIYHTVYQEEFGIPIEEIGNEIFGHAMVARGTGSMLKNVSEIENMDIPYEMIYNHAKVVDIGNEDIRKNGNIKEKIDIFGIQSQKYLDRWWIIWS